MEASRRRRSDGALRPRMRSPGRPPFGRRETPSSERGSDSAAPLSKGDANQIRHHQPQELTVRENGAGPSYGVYCAGGGPTPRSHDV